MIKKYSEYLKESIDFDEDEGMEIEEEPDDFISNRRLREFLIKHDCLEEYIKNSENKALDITRVNYPDTFDNQDPMNYISGPFNWDASPQGQKFWLDLHWKWQKIIEKENIRRR